MTAGELSTQRQCLDVRQHSFLHEYNEDDFYKMDHLSCCHIPVNRNHPTCTNPFYTNKVIVRHLSFPQSIPCLKRMMPEILCGQCCSGEVRRNTEHSRLDWCWTGLVTGLTRAIIWQVSCPKGRAGQHKGLSSPMGMPCCSDFIDNDIKLHVNTAKGSKYERTKLH